MSKPLNNSDKTQVIVDKSLAQSGALAVQDAGNNMRDMNTLLSTASGVALANFIEHGDVKYLKLGASHKKVVIQNLLQGRFILGTKSSRTSDLICF